MKLKTGLTILVMLLVFLLPVTAHAQNLYEIFFSDVIDIKVTNCDTMYKDLKSGELIGHLDKGETIYIISDEDDEYYQIKTIDGDAYVLKDVCCEIDEFNGEILQAKLQYEGKVKTTFYGCESWANGGYTTNCTGIQLKNLVGIIVASNNYPLGTKLFIEGIGYRIVYDRGCNHIDVLVKTETEANKLGNTERNIWVIN